MRQQRGNDGDSPPPGAWGRLVPGSVEDERPMIPLRIRGLGSTRDNKRTVILLEDPEQRFRLAFSTDPDEAKRLAREMGRAGCRCNPVYDLIQSFLEAFQATITRVVLEDAGYHGLAARVELRLRASGLGMVLPCYPPDALALALRIGAPIYATASALAQAESTCGQPFLPSDVDVSRWVDRLNPEDF